MANAQVYRGYIFSGVINLKKSDGSLPENLLPYVIPVGADVQVHLPQDTTLGVPLPVVLSTANALPSPLTGNEVTIVSASLGQISFTCPIAKSALMGVGKNLTVDVVVIKDPTTLPNPVNLDPFEKQKIIDVKDLDNL